MSEVKAALSAGDPTARRRRRSSAITPLPAEEIPKQSLLHTPFRGKLARFWDRLGRTETGRVGGEGGDGKYDATETPVRTTPSASQHGSEHREGPGSLAFLASSTTQPRGSSRSMRAPLTGGSPSTSSPFPGETVSGGLAPTAPGGVATSGPVVSASEPLRKASSGAEVTTEPRPAIQEGSDNGGGGDEIARLALARQQTPRNSFFRPGLRGLPPSSFHTDSTAAVHAGAATNGGRARPVSPLRLGSARRRGGSGGAGFGAGSPKRGQPVTAVTPDPRIPMEDFQMCAGGNYAVFLALRWVGSFSGSGESGFEMLVRLALREARHSVLGSFTYWRPGVERPSRKGRPDNGRGLGGTDKNGYRRQSSVKPWDTSATGRSYSAFRSSGVARGVASGSTQPSGAAVEGGSHMSALITGILRENFLAQVRTASFTGLPKVYIGSEQRGCSAHITLAGTFRFQ